MTRKFRKNYRQQIKYTKAIKGVFSKAEQRHLRKEGSQKIT